MSCYFFYTLVPLSVCLFNCSRDTFVKVLGSMLALLLNRMPQVGGFHVYYFDCHWCLSLI